MNINDWRKELKKNKLVFFTYKKITDNAYRSGILDYLMQKPLKDRETVKKETTEIKKFWQCDPMFYYRYRLFEKNLTHDEILDYVPPYYFYNYYMPNVYRNCDTDVVDSKIRMNEFFISRNIDTPKKIATILRGVINDESGTRIDSGELKDLLIRNGSRFFFMKPDGGRGGKGIYKIEKIGNEIFLNDEFLDEETLDEIIKDKDFLIQEGIIQRRDLKDIYPSSVNTLRVITQYFGNEVDIPAVVLRMGKSGSFVDNSSVGGVFASVDTENGAISGNAHLLHDKTKFDRHPDTGFRFEGFVLKDWDKIKSEIKEIARKAPEFPDVAWDVAVLENKITIIEINLNYGLDQLQCCIGGMRRRLKIDPVQINKKV